MMGERELDQLIQLLRRYHRAVRATSGGLHQFQTSEAQAQLEQHLQTAYAIKAQLEEELDGFFQQARLWLEAQQGRLETARVRSEEQHRAE